jgi:hypothetical protein
MIRAKKQTTLLITLGIAFILFTWTRTGMAEGSKGQEESEIILIQATLIVARHEQPGLPRYQISGKDSELIQSAFGGTSGLSAKFIKVMPMSPVPSNDPKKTVGWVMNVGESWSALFQIEKVERTWQQKETYKTWPLIEFRGGKIFFLEDGIQVSDGLEAKVNKHLYIYKKDKGWTSNKEAK